MIAAAPDQVTTVAVGHGQIPATDLTWQDVREIVRQYLHRTHTEGYAHNIIYEFKHLLPLFPAPPGAMTPKDVSAISKLTKGGRKVILSHVALALIECGAWTLKMLPTYVSRDIIENVLPPEWRGFSARYLQAIIRRNAPKDSCFYWSKWVVLFFWYAKFSPGKPLDGDEMKRKWGEFGDFLKSYTRRATGSMLDRAFASIWNHAIDESLLKADRMRETLISASFWSILQPEIRERIGTHHRGCGDIPPEDEWLYSLRYALCVLGFSVYAQERALAITPEEIEFVHERLKVEKFAPETIERLLGALHQLSASPRGQ